VVAMSSLAHEPKANAYCLQHMLPIWERWTDGNLAMRRALECESADSHTHEERRNTLFQTQLKFEGHGDSAPNLAAMLAAQACQYALLGYPLAMVEQVGAAAIAAHVRASVAVEDEIGQGSRVRALLPSEHDGAPAHQGVRERTT
jgi:hypothetical protein